MTLVSSMESELFGYERGAFTGARHIPARQLAILPHIRRPSKRRLNRHDLCVAGERLQTQ